MLIDKLNSAVKYLIFFSVIALIYYAVPKKSIMNLMSMSMKYGIKATYMLLFPSRF